MKFKTLLVVEASLQMRRLIRLLFDNAAEQIVECPDGSDALAAYANCHPDWVLIDLNIKSLDPGNPSAAAARSLDAISITRRINQLFPEARIAILADYDDPGLREAAQLAGALAYFIKDDLSSLPDLLTRHLSGPNTRPAG
jgi:DNA-binding NarL/FixJ family response regulator